MGRAKQRFTYTGRALQRWRLGKAGVGALSANDIWHALDWQRQAEGNAEGTWLSAYLPICLALYVHRDGYDA
jgi:hypothetical protein